LSLTRLCKKIYLGVKLSFFLITISIHNYLCNDLLIQVVDDDDKKKRGRKIHLPSVMKNKSTTFPSGVVITFSLWIVNSSSVRTSVTSTLKKQSHVISIPWIKQRKRKIKHQVYHPNLHTYRVIILSGQHSKTSTDIQKEQPRNHSVSDHNKGESNMEETLSRAGFSSYPNQV
jgi:hypothetical protein